MKRLPDLRPRPVSTIMSEQSAVLSVPLEDELKRYIRTIGLYNTKAANIIKTARILLEKHGGEVPSDRKSLEALPGVGRKTANVVLNTAFGEPTIAVDTHIFPGHPGFLLAMLPPGAFIGLGLMIAGKNWLDTRRATRQFTGGQTVNKPVGQVGAS